MKSAYPELPLVSPQPTNVGLEESAHILLGLSDECLARAVFAIMYAEASKTKDKTSFRSAGNYNYSGIQTDTSRWNYSEPIINRFQRVDSGGVFREFAGFKNNEGFFDFMTNRIKAKGFDGCNADNWTQTYIQKWWSPKDKAQFVKGTKKYNDKKAIYESAMIKFDKYKNTYTGASKKKTKFELTTALMISLVIVAGYVLYKKLKRK